MQDTNLKHSWDLYAGSHANAVSMIANILICAQDQTPQVLRESPDTSGHIFAYAHCCVGLSAGRLAHPGHGARTCWPGCKACLRYLCGSLKRSGICRTRT